MSDCRARPTRAKSLSPNSHFRLKPEPSIISWWICARWTISGAAVRGCRRAALRASSWLGFRILFRRRPFQLLERGMARVAPVGRYRKLRTECGKQFGVGAIAEGALGLGGFAHGTGFHAG